MKKYFLLLVLLPTTCWLTAQVWSSNKISTFKNKKQLLTCTDQAEQVVLQMTNNYKTVRDQTSRKKIKFLKLRGQKYQIRKVKKGKEVVDQKGKVVAITDRLGKKLYLTAQKQEYTLLSRHTAKMIYYDEAGKAVVSGDFYKKEAYIQLHQADNTAKDLLMALCLNELVERKKEANNGWLTNGLLILSML